MNTESCTCDCTFSFIGPSCESECIERKYVSIEREHCNTILYCYCVHGVCAVNYNYMGPFVVSGCVTYFEYEGIVLDQ